MNLKSAPPAIAAKTRTSHHRLIFCLALIRRSVNDPSFSSANWLFRASAWERAAPSREDGSPDRPLYFS